MRSTKRSQSSFQRKSPRPKGRPSSSSRPKSKQSYTPRPPKCNLCNLKPPTACHLSHSLYRKYSYSQNHHYLTSFKVIAARPDSIPLQEDRQECLRGYYKARTRKVAWQRMAEEGWGVGGSELPRIFVPGVSKILAKCHHRKKLLAYFRLAKKMGIKLQNISLSSFALSNHTTPRDNFSFVKILQLESEQNENLAIHANT